MTQQGDPWPGFDWKTAILIGEREQALIVDPTRHDQNLKLAKINSEVQGRRRAERGIVLRPYLVQAVNLPHEFADWEGRAVNLRLDLLGEQGVILWDEVTVGVAIAMKKSGQWFAIKTSACSEGRLLEVLSIDECQAARLLCLPYEWESKVEIRKEESQ